MWFRSIDGASSSGADRQRCPRRRAPSRVGRNRRAVSRGVSPRCCAPHGARSSGSHSARRWRRRPVATGARSTRMGRLDGASRTRRLAAHGLSRRFGRCRRGFPPSAHEEAPEAAVSWKNHCHGRAMGGTPGSLAGGLFAEGTMYTSTFGMSSMRGCGSRGIRLYSPCQGDLAVSRPEAECRLPSGRGSRRFTACRSRQPRAPP
jgi:hypothetical protein